MGDLNFWERVLAVLLVVGVLVALGLLVLASGFWGGI